LGQIDWFIINKYYTVRQSHSDFRPKIREAEVVLKERGKQIVFLTATMSPASEAEFFETIQMPAIPAIWGPIIQPNIRYSIFEYKEECNQIDAIDQVVR
jgi:superfamily II DNA helicase RecQ